MDNAFDDLMQWLKNRKKEDIKISNWKEALYILAAPVSEVDINDDGIPIGVLSGKFGAAYSYLFNLLQNYDRIVDFLTDDWVYFSLEDNYLVVDGSRHLTKEEEETWKQIQDKKDEIRKQILAGLVEKI